ncbi:hypothetical protein [Pseudomonas sp. KK4]|uniref:hypothetical protein n=1 Tax=Pseudomonas sp. KK4 TaxID=1855729 RepID=UPI00097C347B|nr:hypothetical protein [Pseudomonas sp. KK4]
MKRKILVLAAAFMLAACGQGDKSVQVLLDDGAKLRINGTLVKEYSKSSSEGTLKVNNVLVDDSPKEAEEAIAKEFKRLGYRRKIIDSSDGVYKVHYYKQDRPVVGGIYTQPKGSVSSGAHVSIYWEI